MGADGPPLVAPASVADTGLAAAAAAPVAFAVAAFAVAAFSLSAYAAEPDGRYELGRKLFTEGAVPACALCHTMKDAGAEGAVGPSLDELRPDAVRVAKALRNGIGQMPSYKASLSEAEIEAIAAYVSKAVEVAQ